jgi:hypothetical protein
VEPADNIIKKISIQDITGKRVLSIPGPVSEISIAHFQAGMYMVIVATELGETMVSRLVKE